ncbi:MAG: hypothetical protein IJW59_02995, partial [Clostridia bacterium]|nr:hypothetical protein [Clostridia bacterium]
NWNELTNIKEIKHNDFNINTPMKYWLCECNDISNYNKKMTTLSYVTTIMKLFIIIMMNITIFKTYKKLTKLVLETICFH